ncbi:putative chaperone DNAJ protein [Leishmania infantum JPCM5]|uniref:Chaperone_DNAJ_protein_-_putative n=2 Tax=Leishmania infantum TaxID=5671 RepID=A0A6L0XHR2_LEIIN|nr:putative chaperone DNAJ protein [Leishmania infantum JPCM5]CAC9481524.1 chaperone_DNAJ_protein_-_putative [Leishmania infantum]CAM67195.1 putative chaperone DNAJ protein [Leishmania infantum JPCM5]SUZ41070.1 chaperone_DNAJ_protein_-_putative [Leishmania infantum]|eukprot:XP_001464954.1 putative chaperone DNAJ protein [Leishmania infantum JPCM5]
MEGRPHYEVLCIANFSSAEEVRLAYKSLVLKYHPDKNLGDPTAAERFRAVCRAYEVLSNEETKRKYDLALRAALFEYGPRASGKTGGHGGANPYSMKAPSMSDIYRELYQRQAARASTRNRTSSAPPQSGKASTSQYTKAQQEHFRKRERERQQELRRQRERERKEQRDREREALRREQERQEELLQQRWRLQQQQQKVYPTRGSTRITSTAGAASLSTGTTSDPAAHIDDVNGVSPRMRRGSPRATTEGVRSGIESHAPNTVLLGTPARLTMLARNGVATTPRTFRAYSPLSLSPRPAAKPRCAEAGAPGEPPSSSAWREEETMDAEAVEGGLSTGWYTPLNALVNSGDLEEGAAHYSSCAGSPVGAEEQAMAQSAGVNRAFRTGSAPLLRPASGVARASGVDARSAASAQPSTRNTHTTSEDCSEDGTAAGCGDDGHRTPSSYRPATRITTVNRVAMPSASSTATTPRHWGTPRSFTNFHAAAAASPVSLAASPRGQPITPRCSSSAQMTANGRSHSSSAGAASTEARASQSLHKSSSINGATSRSDPVRASFLHRVLPMPSLADKDKEVLDKKRRERLAKEKERQRSVRLAEEERQFRRLARAAKHQRENAAAISAAAAAAKAEVEEPLSFEKELGYLVHDEASEREQLIEREEQLAWRRLHRQQAKVIQAVLVRRRLAALTTEEMAWRNGLLQVCWVERDRSFLCFYERLDRLYLEGREGRDRRQLVGREAADRYHVRRASQRRSSMATEEASQRRQLSGSAVQAVLGQGVPATEAVDCASSPAAEAKARRSPFPSVYDDAAQLEHRCDAGARLAGNQPWHQQQSEYQQQHPAEWLPPAALAAQTTSALDAKRGRARSAVSTTAVTDISTTGHLESFLSATGTLEAAPAMADRLSGGSAFARASAQASPHASPKKRSSLDSSSSTDCPAVAVTTSANGETKMLLAGAERRLLMLVSDESRQRSLLVKQQQQEEMALRRRRAMALHCVFAKEKENAVKHAQRCALVEITALRAQLRTLQRQTRRSSSPRSMEGGSSAAAASAASGSPANSVSWKMESSAVSRHGSPLPMLPRPTSEAAAAACASSPDTARALSVASILTAAAALSGWTALPDSDGEED